MNALLGPIDLVAVARLVLAALLGGLIGLEREQHGRAAGLRTHLLLSVGCALVMLVSLHLPTLFANYGSDSIFRADPGRMAAQVLTGIGFLGAGAIITVGRWIRGLTTAACVWVTAAIGLAIGCGYVYVAVCSFLLVMFALHTMRRWESHIDSRDRYAEVAVRFSRPARRVERLEQLLAAEGFELIEYRVAQDAQGMRYRLQVRYAVNADIEKITTEMAEALSEEGLVSIEWR